MLMFYTICYKPIIQDQCLSKTQRVLFHLLLLAVLLGELNVNCSTTLKIKYIRAKRLWYLVMLQ